MRLRLIEHGCFYVAPGVMLCKSITCQFLGVPDKPKQLDIEIIPNAVDLPCFEYKIEGEDCYIFPVGSSNFEYIAPSNVFVLRKLPNPFYVRVI